MSSRIFRMWPALGLALLVAAVFHWGAGDAQAEVGAMERDVAGRLAGIESVSAQTPTLKVSPSGPLTVTEGSSNTYVVSLSGAPSGRVVVQPEFTAAAGFSSDGRAVVMEPTALVFTHTDYGGKTVRVHVSENDSDDEAVPNAGSINHRLFGAVTGVVSNPALQVAVNDDDDVAGVNLPPTGSLAEGDSFAYLVSLKSDPGEGKTVVVGLPDSVPGAVSYLGGPSSLAFTSANWRIPQAFVVKGVRDEVDSRNRVVDVTHTVGASGTNGYDGFTLSPVRITVVDDDTRGLSFSPEGLVLAEGASSTYTVMLKSKPSNGDVTVTLSAGGALAKAVKAGSDPETNQITFTADDDAANSWNSPQTVTVTAAAPDSSFTGVRSGIVTHSFSGGGYSGSEKFSVQVFDSKRSATSPLIISGGGPPFMTLNETGSGRASTYRVRLRNAPSGAVTVSLASSDTSVATVSPSTLAFDASSHGFEQLVTVTAEQDNAALRRDRFAQISHSLSGALSGSGGYVGVKVLDADPAPSAPEVRFVAGEHCALSGTVPECSGVPEGGTGKYSVELSGLKPSGTVTLRVTSSNPSAVSVSPDVLHFTPSTWLNSQAVTVRSNGDGIVDDDVAGAVLTHRVSGGGYDAVSVPPVEVSVSSTVADGDTGLVFSDAPILLSEGEGGSYGVRLKSKPAGVVTVFLDQPVVSGDAPQFSVDRSQMVFTPSNWDTAQIVRVTSFDDDDVNGTRHFSIGYRVSSGSHGYLSGELGSVELRITDEDRDGVVISTTTMTLQPGATGTYTVRLASARSENVAIEPADKVSPDSIAFNQTVGDDEYWSRDQVITVIAPDDAGDFTISHAIGSKQVGYVFVRVVSGAGAGVVISPSSLSIDAGGFSSYGVRLSAPPSGGNVVITASVSDSTVATVSGLPLTFNESNWDDPQTVTVIGVSAGNAVIRHTANGGGFSGQFVGSVNVVVGPGSGPGPSLLKLSKARLELTHGTSDNSGVYMVRLTGPPASDVSVEISISADGVATVSPRTVVLNSSNWEDGVPVTVTSAGLGKADISHTGSGGYAPTLEVLVFGNSPHSGFSFAVSGPRPGSDPGPAWAFVGDTVTFELTGSAFGESGKVWFYRVPSRDGTPPSSCYAGRDAVVNLHDGNFVSADFASPQVLVSGALFEVGANFLCVVDAHGKGFYAKPLVLNVYEPPDTYRVWLKDLDFGSHTDSGHTLDSGFHADSKLPGGFRVFHGKQGLEHRADDTHDDAWALPQRRGTGNADGTSLTKTGGTLHHCDDVTVGERQIGCDWGDASDRAPGEVGMEPALAGDDAVSVPGDEFKLRVQFEGSDEDLTRERFAIFWGPQDLWRLSADENTGDFVINAEHGSEDALSYVPPNVVQGSHRREDGFYEFTIPRSSASWDGDTYVALVRCNLDHLPSDTGEVFASDEVKRNKLAFGDCSSVTVPHMRFDMTHRDADEDRKIVPLRMAWAQHEVDSGRGLVCDARRTYVALTRTRELIDGSLTGWAYAREYRVFCHNDEASLSKFTKAEVERCDDVLRAFATVTDAPGNFLAGSWPSPGADDLEQTVEFRPAGGKDLMCGLGPAKPIIDHAPWGTARYNSSRMLYGFVIDWQRGGPRVTYGSNCDTMLLPYVRSGGRFYAKSEPHPSDPSRVRPVATGEWRLTHVNGEREDVPDDGLDAAVDFCVPSHDPDWDATWRSWYYTRKAHFVVYMSGMPAEHDYRVGGDEEVYEEGVAGGGGFGEGDTWRRIALGGWDWKNEQVSGDDSPPVVDPVPGGVRRRLGSALPVNSDGVGPLDVGDFRGGYSLSVSRDYADAEGKVHLYVVPCMPWHTDPSVGIRLCDDLPDGANVGNTLSFRQVQSTASGSPGPFGVTEPASSPGEYVIDYSLKYTVEFGDIPEGAPKDRPVSLPRRLLNGNTDACEISVSNSEVAERLLYGGGCDPTGLVPVDVVLKRSAVAASPQDFLVYATGGRSDGLDLTTTRRSSGVGSEPAQLARLGLLERKLALAGAENSTARVKVTPDMADSDGLVYLFFYECASSLLCPYTSLFDDIDGRFYNVNALPAFAVRVKYPSTGSSAITHSDLGPICQGENCNPVMPVLRAAGPEHEGGACQVNGYSDGVDDLTYWPDRVVSGGACAPGDDSTVTIAVPNSVGHSRPLAFYVTGGRSDGLDRVQVKRGPAGSPAGAAGLRRLHVVSESGLTTNVKVAPHMADEQGRILLLAYDCSDPVEDCPEPSAGSFDIMERPLFQVLVQYGDDDVPQRADLMICEGDECRTSYGVGRRATPDGTQACKVSSFFDGSSHIWPLQLVAGGKCDRDDLNDVSVSFDSLGAHRLVVYATGGRSDGLGLVQVKTPTEGSGGSGGSSSSALPHYPDPMDVPLSVIDGDFSGLGSADAANVIDGGSLLRAHNTENMQWVHSQHVDLYNAMAAKSWVQDGLIDVEKSALDYLLYIAVGESTTAAVAKRVVAMPFLATLDSTDELVLRGLNRAAARGFAARILDHSALSSGIADAQRVLVIGASTMSSRSPLDVDGLLSNGYAGGVVSSVSSGVRVTVARRTAASQSYVPTVIASAMRGIRGLMGSPFPVDHIVAQGDSASVLPGAAGTNYGFAISYLPRHEVADSGGAADQLKSTLVHEVAHYYWRGAQPWVNEGMASAFEVFLASDFNLPDSVVINEQGTCTLANLRALVRAAPSLGSSQFYCNYYLGQRLFLALHEAMGESAFMAGARALYADVSDCRTRREDRCGDIEDVMAAFSSQRELVEEHWGGTLPPVTGGAVAPVAASNDLGRLGLFENRLIVTANAEGVVTLSPDQADADGNIYLLAYVCDGGHGGSGCPILGRPALTGYALGTGPDFAVQVRFTEKSGLEHSDVGVVCQGSNCSPPTPVLRAAAPDPEESCSARVRTAAADDLTYWPDRVILGGACDPNSFEPITFTLENGTNYQRPVVVYSTGGSDFPHLQLRRSGVATFDDGTGRGAAGSPSGKQGLKRDVLTGAGGVTVNAAMADDDGLVWLLGYDCNGSSAGCPLPVGASDPTVFNIESRPLFQVLTRFSDEPGIIIEPRDVSLREGGSGEYTVRLTTKPEGNVTVTLSLNVLGALTIEPSTLVLEFTLDNWDDTQTVRVTSVNNDDVEDRTVVISHAVAGADYGGRVCGDGCPVTVSIEDDDAYGASLSRTVLTIHEGTAAAPGIGEYTVVLSARPTGPVAVALTADPAAGVITVPASLTFTPGDWDVPQTVRVTAVYDDAYHVPARTAGITHSFSGGGYDSTVSVPAVNVTVVDAQLPSVGITGPGGAVIPGNRLVMRVGETRDYEISLGSRPVQPVTMSLSAAPSGVVSVSPDSLTFSTASWSAAQVVTITADAVGEAVIDHQGSGELYDRVRIPSIQVEVLPASNPGAQLSPASPISLAKGAVGQYRLSLTQRPVGEVAVSVTSSGSAATVSPKSVVFNGSNWRRGHAFAVTAGDAVGSVTFTHDFSGGGYDGLADLNMTVNVVEPGGPGIIIGTSHDGVFVAPDGDDPAVQDWDVSVDVQRGWWGTLVSGVTHVVSYVESWWPFGHGSSHGGDGLDAVAAGHAGLKWAWVGNEIAIQLTGFTSGNRVWAYLVVPDQGAGVPSSCVTTDVSTVFVAVGDVSSDGNSPVFTVPVSLDTFSLGENYVCAVDGAGRKLAVPQTFVVHEPPDMYRMELTLNDVEVGPATGNLGDGFQVINGRHHGENPWKSPQIRGNSADAGDYRTKTNFSWRRCAGGPDNSVDGAQVGCEWLSDHHPAMVHEPWRVGMVAVPDGGAAAVAVPGDDVELRVKLGPTQFTGREVARFAVYWGPVDLWMLGSPSGPADDDGPTEARAYAIHRDHLSGLRQKLVAQRDVAPDGSYTFTVPRSSANDRGDTFVAIVPCNVDYIGFGDEELARNKRSLSDCDTPLNSRASFDSVVSEDQDDDPHTLLRAAWQQHDVLSGRGLVCDLTVVEETVDGRTVREYDADCGNPARSTHSDFTDSAVRECDGYLRNPGTLPVGKTSGLLCGWGPVEPIGSVTTWASTDYNALRSVYGFVIDWQRGGALGVSDNDGCEVDLLKYRLDRSDAGGANNDAGGARIRRVSLLENGHPIGAKYWRVGKSLEKHCTAPPDADELDVTFYTPFADDEWSSEYRDWHNNEPVHFALYVTGLPAEHDDRSAGGDGVSGGDGDSEWSRVALGSWDIRAPGLANSGGSRRLLGYAMPLKDYEFGTRTVPNIEDFTDGVEFTVPREYADSNGRVRLYVVPCLPLYGPAPSADAYHGPCYDVARSAPDHDANAGIARPAIFERASDSRGPFGLLTGSSDYLLRYSYEVVVTFDALPDVSEDGIVSVPTTTVTPSGDECRVQSRDDGTWKTVLVTGGPCEVEDDSSLRVYFENDGIGGNTLSLYGTGGRSPDLDLVRVNRMSGGIDEEGGDALGRLGLLERARVHMGAASSETDVASVLVTPDMADADGNVWLVAYHCTGPLGTDNAICPRSSRKTALGEVPTFHMRVTHSFMVQVKYKNLTPSDIGPICQGDNCSPAMPWLRLAEPDGNDVCQVDAWSGGGVRDLTYWPDRVIAGGACAPDSDGNLRVVVRNTTAYPQKLVTYVTGGRSNGLALVQVRRGGGDGGDGVLAGAVGLRVEERVVSPNGSAVLTLDAGMADSDGRILLLAYDCGLGDGGACPAATSGNDQVTFAVQRRPLFQLLVGYDSVVIQRSGLAICKGDDCQRAYPLGRFALPDSAGCGISAFGSGGGIYWPRSIVAGGDCDVDTLTEVPVEFRVPAGGVERLRIYATGRRVPQLDEVSVLRAGQASLDAALPYYADPAYRALPETPSFAGDGRPGSGGNPSIADPTGLLAMHNTVNMRWVQTTHPALYDKMGAKAWVTDGLTAVEKRLLDNLLYLAAEQPRNPKAALSVVDMGFMGGSSVDALDYITVGALFAALDDGRLTAVLRVAGNDGISEAERRKVIYASVMRDSADIGLVTDSYFAVNHVAAPTAGVPITELRPAASVFDNTASINRAVGYLKSKMAAPFPIDHVVAVADTKALLPKSAGVNYGGNVISYNPAPEGEHAGDRVKSTIIHEVAHYYWLGGETWISEGMASAIENLGAGAFSPSLPDSVTLKSKGGCTHRTLRDLVEAAPQLDDPQFYCNYYLGQRLFLELHDSLGAQEFWVGARSLHSAIVDCRAARRGECGRIADVRSAFPESAHVIDRHWHGGVRVPTGVGEAGVALGRMGVYEAYRSVSSDGAAQVWVNPDMADAKGHVWLFGYRCDGTDDSSCPRVARPAMNGYDLEVGPDFAVLVRFTPESGLAAADLQEVCRGQQCDILHPWLRRAEPDVGECGARLGTYWPDRVIRGGDCWFRGTRYGAVSFENVTAAEEKFVVYSTGDASGDFGALPVYGELGEGGGDAEDSGVRLGRVGLRENRLTVASGDSAEVYFRSEMAGDDGEVWLFVYRCLASHGDAGCPLVGRDAVRPEYDIGIRPTFVVRAGFVDVADEEVSSLIFEPAGCVGVQSCTIKAIFRDSDGNSLPGTAVFTVDRGTLGEAGSAATTSRRRHTVVDAGEYQFVETLHLPEAGGIVNVTVELLGDGATLRGRAGRAANIASLSVRVLRCADDEASCHSESLEPATSLNRGDRFVVSVQGLDAAGGVGWDAGLQAEQRCTDGIDGAWPVVRLSTTGLRAHPYGTLQLQDRGYAGCAYRVTDDADFGSHGYTVTYSSGGATLSASGAVTVVRSASDLSILGLTGPAQIESGSSGTFHLVGYNAAGLPVGLTGGCVAVDVSGELTGDDDCATTGLPATGFAVEVTANADVVLRTDSSVGVSYRGLSVRRHVLVVPAADDGGGTAAPPVSSGDSGISGLTITPEGSQLLLNWTSTLNADFESLRAQVWVRVGDEDVFLPGCLGGEVHDVSTVEVFCMLSHGQSGDVYHAAVGFIRGDRTAAPVETAQWIRP